MVLLLLHQRFLEGEQQESGSGSDLQKSFTLFSRAGYAEVEVRAERGKNDACSSTRYKASELMQTEL